MRIHGTDFSGGVKAGAKIWIASGVPEGDSIRIESCRRADSLPGSGRDRERCLPALVRFIEGQTSCAVGFDFPFGLPRGLVEHGTWVGFVQSFSQRSPNPDAFRGACKEITGGREWVRVTDRENQTPFSPYNLRLYRQTYFGIRDVLGPLVMSELACVLPMQRRIAGKPWILEVCPASTLKREKLSVSYKGRGQEYVAARSHVLKGLEMTGLLAVRTKEVRSAALSDHEGDALDSIVAAFATCRALRNQDRLSVGSDEPYALEGYVHT